MAELDVTLIEAQDIMKTDVIGKSDPFCMFYVRQKADKIKKSSTKKNKKSAVWNEGFVLEVFEQSCFEEICDVLSITLCRGE